MHTMWKGSVSFGLVNVPIKMFAATESKDVKFRYLHETCKTPIQYVRTCKTCNKEVEWNEIVRGYEYEPGRFVIFTEEELSGIRKERSQTIDIVEFVQLTDIDPIYYDKSYYLAPEASGKKAYALLLSAMEQTGKIAIAKTVLRNNETLACLRPSESSLILETLFWPDEVRSTEELPNIEGPLSVTDKELDMAVTLINQLETKFEPEKYKDERRQETMALIEQKISNNDVSLRVVEEGPKQNIADLMQALQESIKMTKPAVTKRKRTKKTS
jgi:DNA end-binding protein Ku